MVETAKSSVSADPYTRAVTLCVLLLLRQSSCSPANIAGTIHSPCVTTFATCSTCNKE